MKGRTLAFGKAMAAAAKGKGSYKAVADADGAKKLPKSNSMSKGMPKGR